MCIDAGTAHAHGGLVNEWLKEVVGTWAYKAAEQKDNGFAETWQAVTKGRDFELLRVANCEKVHKGRRVRGAKGTLVGFVPEIPLVLSLGWKSLEQVVSGD